MMSGPQQTSSFSIHTGSSHPMTYSPTGSQVPSQSYQTFSGHPANQINPYQDLHQDSFKGANQFQTPTPYYTSATNFQTTDDHDHHHHHLNENYINDTQSDTWTTPLPPTTAMIGQQTQTATQHGIIGQGTLNLGHGEHKRTILEEIRSKMDARMTLTFAFLVALATVICILTEDDVPLTYSLTCVSILSLAIFIKSGW